MDWNEIGKGREVEKANNIGSESDNLKATNYLQLRNAIVSEVIGYCRVDFEDCVSLQLYS